MSDGNEIQAKKTPNKPRSPSGVPSSIWFFRAAQSSSSRLFPSDRAVPGTYQRLWRHLLDMYSLHPSKKGRRGSVRWGRGQARPCLTHENKVTRSHLPPLAKQMAQQPGGWLTKVLPWALGLPNHILPLMVRDWHASPSSTWAQAPLSGEENQV